MQMIKTMSAPEIAIFLKTNVLRDFLCQSNRCFKPDVKKVPTNEPENNISYESSCSCQLVRICNTCASITPYKVIISSLSRLCKIE